MAEQAIQKVSIQYCRHCRTSSCLDTGFEFNRVREHVKSGRILVRSRFERVSSVVQKKKLGGILLALERKMHIEFKDIGRCEQCRSEIRQAGGFARHILTPRQKTHLEDTDGSYGSLGNAVRNLEGD